MRRDLIKIKKIEEEVSTDKYSRFIIEPFNRGLATTFGSTLRRMLLSCVEGSAVTSVKIEGILHEFSTIKGVVEDVVDIILNIKKLIVKQHNSDTAILHLLAEGEGEVRADQIIAPPTVEIINKDLHIATLAKDGRLNMEIEVDRGYGYVPAEMLVKEDDVIGRIPIDANFSPVVKANFYVEDISIGSPIPQERLVLEVWTNGSISPKEALEHAARITQDYLSVFIKMEPQIKEEPLERIEFFDQQRRLKEILKTDVEELELSVRAFNCFKEYNIKVLAQLVMLSERQILKMKNFGRKSLLELKERLSIYGLRFDMGNEVRNLAKEVLEELHLEPINIPITEGEEVEEGLRRRRGRRKKIELMAQEGEGEEEKEGEEEEEEEEEEEIEEGEEEEEIEEGEEEEEIEEGEEEEEIEEGEEEKKEEREGEE